MSFDKKTYDREFSKKRYYEKKESTFTFKAELPIEYKKYDELIKENGLIRRDFLILAFENFEKLVKKNKGN